MEVVRGHRISTTKEQTLRSMRLTVNKTVQQLLLLTHKPTTVASNSHLVAQQMLRVQELAPKPMQQADITDAVK